MQETRNDGSFVWPPTSGDRVVIESTNIADAPELSTGYRLLVTDADDVVQVNYF